MNEDYHESVLLQETVIAVAVKKGKKYIDATLGGGGHTKELLRLGAKVLGIDQDEDALNFVHSHIGDSRLTTARGNFGSIKEIAVRNDYPQVSGILFDLGVSSFQLDTPERGFSFLKEAPLDMRMDNRRQVTAADLVNGLTKHELVEVFTKLGEENFAQGIAQKISKHREVEPITTTTQLAELIAKGYPGKRDRIHPATKVFQALRIAVNDELGSLRDALPQAIELLESKGRLAIITFHSLEDRIVKHAFIDFEKQGLGHVITKKPIYPTGVEEDANRRSRSAKLRVFEKI